MINRAKQNTAISQRRLIKKPIICNFHFIHYIIIIIDVDEKYT